MLEIRIIGTQEEVAALVLAVQERQKRDWSSFGDLKKHATRATREAEKAMRELTPR